MQRSHARIFCSRVCDSGWAPLARLVSHCHLLSERGFASSARVPNTVRQLLRLQRQRWLLQRAAGHAPHSESRCPVHAQ